MKKRTLREILTSIPEKDTSIIYSSPHCVGFRVDYDKWEAEIQALIDKMIEKRIEM
ncbi:hypothetical protein HQ584_13215 [Patescibacteria group bacterium]|nr:hypothetical protein [Patescibacteria group bacterium]